MLEAARILASVGVILLVAAVTAWANPLGRTQLRRPNGSTVANRANHQIAALLLLSAFGLSAAGAALAIAGWFAT
jgi:hypothetical protein